MGVNGIYGLSGSGMDIESMVKVGMMSKQNEYDKMAQKYTKNEWMKADYIELSNKITTFNSSSLSQYKMSNTMNAKSVESSSAASADLMNHSVDVLSLSSNAYLVGTNTMKRYAINGASSADQTSIRLADVLFKELDVTGGYVSGRVAPSDMADDDRDDPNYTAADGKRVGVAWQFGKADIVHTSIDDIATHWEKYNSATGQWETADPLSSSSNRTSWVNSQKADAQNALGSEWRHAYSATYGIDEWRTKNSSGNFQSTATDPASIDETTWKNFLASQNKQTEWRLVADGKRTETAAALSNIDVNADEPKAFSFTLSDGVTTNDDGTLKEVTISYSYKQLLGDGDTDGVTFNDLVREINNSGLNIKANYDADHDRFSFYNSKSGDENGIIIKLDADDGYTGTRASMVARNFFNNMGLYQSRNGELYGHDDSGNVVAAEEADKQTLKFSVGRSNDFMGENGKIKIDGVTYNDVVDNKLTVGGITYTALLRRECYRQYSRDRLRFAGR